MTMRRLPATYYRGGTSRALVFHARDLPADRSEWDAIFLSAMGVPDSNGRNLDGMGGGLSSLNKVCVVGPSSRDDADVDYTFAQCAVKEARVDYGGNCGNMSAAIGPFAVEADRAPEEKVGIDDAQHHVGVGNGRLGSAGAVAGLGLVEPARCGKDQRPGEIGAAAGGAERPRHQPHQPGCADPRP